MNDVREVRRGRRKNGNVNKDEERRRKWVRGDARICIRVLVVSLWPSGQFESSRVELSSCVDE